jgi:hypothetical protein
LKNETSKLNCGDNIKMPLKEKRYEGLNRIVLTVNRYVWGAVVGTVKKIRIP